MATITLYGFPQSTYTRTARLACEEKGVGYDLEGLDLNSAEYRAMHPFGKMPAMRHGDFVLYETAAICRYVDEAFDGPPLQPADARQRARMEQWLSAINDYFYGGMVLGLVFQRFVIPMRGGETDEEAIKAAMPGIEHQLGVVNDALAGNDYLAGDTLSLADLHLLPILFYVKATPEGGAALGGAPAATAWFERMAARPSFAATQPPMPEAAE